MAPNRDGPIALRSIGEDQTRSRTISASPAPPRNSPTRRSPLRNGASPTLPTPPASVATSSTIGSSSSGCLSTTSTDCTNSTVPVLRKLGVKAQEGTWKRWLPSQHTLKILGAFIAFVTLLIAIIGLSPSFRSQYLDKQNLAITIWSARQQYVANCIAMASEGNVSENCQKAIDSFSEDIPPHIVSRTIHRLLGDGDSNFMPMLLFMVLALTALGILYVCMHGAFGRLTTLLQTVQRNTPATAQQQGDQTQSSEVLNVEELTAEPSQPSELVDDSDYILALFGRLYSEYSKEGLRNKADFQRDFENRLNTYVELDERYFRCAIHNCRKLFKSYKFWCKHVENHHEEFLKDGLRESDSRRDNTTPHPTYLPYQRPISNPDNGICPQGSLFADCANREVPSESKWHPARGALHRSWFIPADGIAREVITADIQRYLGNDAVVRPGIGTGEYEGVKGYYYTAYRALTSAMVQDLRADSALWMDELKARSQSQDLNPELPSQSSYSQRPSNRLSSDSISTSTPANHYYQPLSRDAAYYPTGYASLSPKIPIERGRKPYVAKEGTGNVYYNTSNAAMDIRTNMNSGYSYQTSYQPVNTADYERVNYRTSAAPNSTIYDISGGYGSMYQNGTPREARTGYYIASDGREYPLYQMPTTHGRS